jgi:hypothetical protein
MSYGGARYSGFRWGSATPLAQAGGGAEGTEPQPDIISAEDAYGSGLALATNDDIRAGRADYPFDLYTDERGALATVSGLRYLIQGVAVKFVSAANQIVGQTWNPNTRENTRADLSLAVAQIATNDERVTEIRDVTIATRPLPDTVTVEMTVIAERAAHEAVFAIGGAATPP